jgi:prepilin-type N-terminal cleavage/methylation domain-containing protein
MRKGFTLIEYLVVISIISILIAMIHPALIRAKKQSEIDNVRKSEQWFGIGKVVFVKTLNIKGVVNNFYTTWNATNVTIVTVGTNGVPVTLEHIDIRLLSTHSETLENP